MPERTSNELTESEEQYRLLDASDHPETSEGDLPFPAPTMGSDSSNKSEERRGDKLAAYGALVFVCITWFTVFTNHPYINGVSLGIGCFTYGILTLQPTAHPKTKTAGLQRHQKTMLVLGFPCIALGTLAIEIHKINQGYMHFATWHGIFGVVSVVWLVGQVILGGGSVWYGGAAFGGGMKAKMLWKYHRLSGYVLFPLLLITAHLGGAWSSWFTSHSQPVVRFVGYTVAPIVTILAIYARVRTSKMKFI
ncbi:hypothetical protein EDB19DRAFT_1897045 [Suillus lakei]|nr:hypothetical protein EDB19DRAFT_1897045 [Suillus lakei]